MTTNESFESSFKRIEEILQLMNDGKLSLDESIQLFEEADHLIGFCSKKLVSAEQKVEQLMKNRDGSLKMGENEKPLMKDYVPI